MLFWNNRPFLLVKPFHAVQVHCSWAEHVFSCSQTKMPQRVQERTVQVPHSTSQEHEKVEQTPPSLLLGNKDGSALSRVTKLYVPIRQQHRRSCYRARATFRRALRCYRLTVCGHGMDSYPTQDQDFIIIISKRQARSCSWQERL